MNYRVILVDDDLRMYGEEAYKEFNDYNKALSCFNSVVADLKSDSTIKEAELTLVMNGQIKLHSFSK